MIIILLTPTEVVYWGSLDYQLQEFLQTSHLRYYLEYYKKRTKTVFAVWFYVESFSMRGPYTNNHHCSGVDGRPDRNTFLCKILFTFSMTYRKFGDGYSPHIQLTQILLVTQYYSNSNTKAYSRVTDESPRDELLHLYEVSLKRRLSNHNRHFQVSDFVDTGMDGVSCRWCEVSGAEYGRNLPPFLGPSSFSTFSFDSLIHLSSLVPLKVLLHYDLDSGLLDVISFSLSLPCHTSSQFVAVTSTRSGL